MQLTDICLRVVVAIICPSLYSQLRTTKTGMIVPILHEQKLLVCIGFNNFGNTNILAIFQYCQAWKIANHRRFCISPGQQCIKVPKFTQIGPCAVSQCHPSDALKKSWRAWINAAGRIRRVFVTHAYVGKT